MPRERPKKIDKLSSDLTQVIILVTGTSIIKKLRR